MGCLLYGLFAEQRSLIVTKRSASCPNRNTPGADIGGRVTNFERFSAATSTRQSVDQQSTQLCEPNMCLSIGNPSHKERFSPSRQMSLGEREREMSLSSGRTCAPNHKPLRMYQYNRPIDALSTPIDAFSIPIDALSSVATLSTRDVTRDLPLAHPVNSLSCPVLSLRALSPNVSVYLCR